MPSYKTKSDRFFLPRYLKALRFIFESLIPESLIWCQHNCRYKSLHLTQSTAFKILFHTIKIDVDMLYLVKNVFVGLIEEFLVWKLQ